MHLRYFGGSHDVMVIGVGNRNSNDSSNPELHIDLRPGQTSHSKVMHRKEVTHSDGSYEKKSLRWAWLTIWDKVKSHGTVID